MPFWPAPRTHDQTVCFTCRCKISSVPSRAWSHMHSTSEHTVKLPHKASDPQRLPLRPHQLQLLQLNTSRRSLQDLHSHLSMSVKSF